jgi:hypothetical protein
LIIIREWFGNAFVAVQNPVVAPASAELTPSRTLRKKVAGDQWYEIQEESSVKYPWPSTYVNMARQGIELNRTQDAIRSLTRALELDPSSKSVYTMRSRIFQRQEDYAAAVRDYGHAFLTGHIDVPSEGARVSGRVLAGGWAFSNASPIVNVSVSVDDQAAAPATIDISRPDVAKAFPTESAPSNSGWHTILDTSRTPVGEHELVARARLQNGLLLELGSVKIVVAT